jgi:hypothetical protein
MLETDDFEPLADSVVTGAVVEVEPPLVGGRTTGVNTNNGTSSVRLATVVLENEATWK